MPSVRELLPALVPRAFRKRLYSIVARLLPARFAPEIRLERLVRELTGMVVFQGPFAGMKYVHRAVGSGYLPKLLGTYELELYPVVEKIVAANFETLFNIGAAEGYYAVGLARSCPSMKVVAYEREESGREAIREMAAANHVSNVTIEGNCEPADLARALQGAGRSLVVVDIEGAEFEMLDLAKCPALAGAHILVELHEMEVRGITATLQQRFAGTHVVEHIWERARTLADFPLKSPRLALMPNYALLDTMREWRAERMAWLWMIPRS